MCKGLCWSSAPQKRLLGSRARFLLTGRQPELSSDRLDFSKPDFLIDGLVRVSCPASRPGCSSDFDLKFSKNFLEFLCSGWEGSITDRAATSFPLRLSILLKWAILCLGMNLLQKGNAIWFLWKQKVKLVPYLPIRTQWRHTKLREKWRCYDKSSQENATSISHQEKAQRFEVGQNCLWIVSREFLWLQMGVAHTVDHKTIDVVYHLPLICLSGFLFCVS